MKILVNKLPDKPEQCLFCIEPPTYAIEYPCKCKFMLNATDYDDGLIWSKISYNNCSLCNNKPCPYLQVLYGSASW